MNTQPIVIIVLLVLVVALFASGYYLYNRVGSAIENNKPAEAPPSTVSIAPTAAPAPSASLTKAVVETDRGTFTVELYSGDAPKTVANFVKLAEAKFYDGLLFHRVVAGFVIQGGDPNCSPDSKAGTPSRAQGLCGSGGPGYQFEDELNPATPSYQAGYKKGVVAMANAGPNTNGSQFFVMLTDNPTLPHNYTIFGRVLSGQSIVDGIGHVAVGAQDRPITPVVIKHITIQ